MIPHKIYTERMMSMFLNEATKLRAQTIIKGLEKRNMHGVFCATKEDALKQALSYIKEEYFKLS